MNSYEKRHVLFFFQPLTHRPRSPSTPPSTPTPPHSLARPRRWAPSQRRSQRTRRRRRPRPWRRRPPPDHCRGSWARQPPLTTSRLSVSGRCRRRPSRTRGRRLSLARLPPLLRLSLARLLPPSSVFCVLNERGLVACLKRRIAARGLLPSLVFACLRPRGRGAATQPLPHCHGARGRGLRPLAAASHACLCECPRADVHAPALPRSRPAVRARPSQGAEGAGGLCRAPGDAVLPRGRGQGASMACAPA